MKKQESLYLFLLFFALTLTSQKLWAKEPPSLFEKIEFHLGGSTGNPLPNYYNQHDDEESLAMELFTGGSISLGANFSLSGFLYFPLGVTDSRETNRDEDIKDANGKDIRLVKRELSYDYQPDPYLRFQLEYDIPLHERHSLVFFLGYSQSKQIHLSERYDKTDRDKPILFSRHNRYYLTEESMVKTKSIHTGVNWVFNKRWYASLGLTLSKAELEKSEQSIRTNGEDIAFNAADFFFAPSANNLTSNRETLELAVGIVF